MLGSLALVLMLAGGAELPAPSPDPDPAWANPPVLIECPNDDECRVMRMRAGEWCRVRGFETKSKLVWGGRDFPDGRKQIALLGKPTKDEARDFRAYVTHKP